MSSLAEPPVDVTEGASRKPPPRALDLHGRTATRRWAERLLCLVLSAAVSLGATETFLRTRRDLYAAGYRPSANPRLVYELEPGHRVDWLGAEISREGLHDREFELEKPLGVFRLAVVGDSTSFGWRVGLEQSLPKQLERMLNERGTRRYEVINFSVPGYNTSQEVEVVRDKVLAYHPDLVLLVFTGNDVRICNYLIPEPTWLGALVHRSYLLHGLLRWIDDELATPEGVKYGYPPWWFTFKWKWLGMPYPGQKIYARPGLEETEYDGGNPPLQRWWVPKRYWYMLGYSNYLVHLGAIRDLLAQNSIAFVSSGMLTTAAIEANRKLGVEHVVTGLWPEELVRDYPTDEPLVIPNDGHYTPVGHALAAQRLLDYLIAHDLV